MSSILAIDTSSDFGSIALRVNGVPAGSQNLDAPEGFAHVLFPAIDQLLRQAGISLPAIDCFAAISGPGAFTGLRVGLAAAKGLAEASGQKCAALSTLRVLASLGTHATRAAIMDARRGQVYAAVYDDALRLAVPETVTPLSDWLLRVPEPEEIIAAPAFHAAIRAIWPTAALTAPAVRLADALARCAALERASGAWTDPAAVDANYVRRSDAEVAWHDTNTR